MFSTPGRRTSVRRSPIKRMSADQEFSDIVRRFNSSYEKRQAEKRQKMLDSEHPHIKAVRIERIACPRHILKLKAYLMEIELHQTLKITVDTGAVLTDLTAACHALGHAVEQVEDTNGRALYVTRSR